MVSIRGGVFAPSRWKQLNTNFISVVHRSRLNRKAIYELKISLLIQFAYTCLFFQQKQVAEHWSQLGTLIQIRFPLGGILDSRCFNDAQGAFASECVIEYQVIRYMKTLEDVNICKTYKSAMTFLPFFRTGFQKN